MRHAALAGLLLWQAAGQSADQPPAASPDRMRYMRSVRVPGHAGEACAVLDAPIFPHATPSLTDLRLFAARPGAHEVPYAITMSEAATGETQDARVLNLGADRDGRRIEFDLAMPDRAYTGVVLQLDPAVHNFIAAAEVTGMESLAAGAPSRWLGTFTLFDLEGQRLSRNSTLPLQESTFRYLHVVLNVAPAPGSRGAQARFGPGLVQGAQVPPSREAQILYTTVAEATGMVTAGRESRATFAVPPRVPVERVEFVPAAGFEGNLSRDVRITATTEARAQGNGDSMDGERSDSPEVLGGSILRVRATEAGREIRTEQLSVPAVLGANLQHPARVEVTIENGDDQPLPIAAVRLEMRQRKLCFEASAAADGTLHVYYGDDRLSAPVYDYAQLFSAARNPLAAALGPEQMNPAYLKAADSRSFTDRHPEVLWIALITAICVLGAVAVRASKSLGQ